MNTFTVVFSILGGDEYTTDVKAADRNKAINSARQRNEKFVFTRKRM